MLPTHKPSTQSGGYFPNHFPYFLIQESNHEWGGGVEGLGKGHRGGMFNWGGVLHHKGGWGRGVHGLAMMVHKSRMCHV